MYHRGLSVTYFCACVYCVFCLPIEKARVALGHTSSHDAQLMRVSRESLRELNGLILEQSKVDLKDVLKEQESFSITASLINCLEDNAPISSTNCTRLSQHARPVLENAVLSFLAPQQPVNEGETPGEVREFAGILKIKFCWCPAGSFRMRNDCFADEEERGLVDVTLSRGFWMGQTELTQGQWERLMGTTPWSGDRRVKVGTEYPATPIDHGLEESGQVRPDTATEFCRKLTARERAAERLPRDWEYRLPTEAEWEYACRAGTTTAYSFGDDPTKLVDYGWFGRYAPEGENPGNIGIEYYPHAVGLKKPNAWNLYDMHGNVCEWCLDWYAVHHPGGRDPVVVTNSHGLRVARGGSWHDTDESCRSDYRHYDQPNDGNLLDGGFRLAVTRCKVQ